MPPPPPLARLFVHPLQGSLADEGAIFALLREQDALSVGYRMDGNGVELIVGSCEPDVGRFVQGRTDVILGDTPLRIFKKVHVLPYLDTFAYNNDHMYFEYIKPYFDTKQSGEFTGGFDFSFKGVRFNVVGTDPPDSYGVVGQETVVYYEGPSIERKVLERVQLVPFEDGLPERYRPTKLSLDEAALVRDYLRPYFEQRSASVSTGDVLEIQGVKFKVVGTRPAEGGGFGRDTQLACQGVALKTTFEARSKVKAKAKAKAGAAAAAAALGGGAAPEDGGGSGQCAVS